MMAHRTPSSSSITYKWEYDVYLSFYGDDTRLGFASHLHQCLNQRGLRVFLDDECIRTGENITPALFKAIEESRIAIIVFSKNYANSTFCLRELEKVIECFKEESRLIYPVFYHVDPSELRTPRKSYARALTRLEERLKDKRHKVEKWRQALSQVADLKGCHLKPKIANEQECITRITNEVATRINQKLLHVADYPVGVVSRVKEVITYLDLWSTETIKMIGIWGVGGIGKSTIARDLYNSVADNFEGVCFLFNVSKQSKEPNGLAHLQETLLFKLVMEKDLNFGDYHEGIPIIQRRLSQKKILLILDDVDESVQLKALAGSCKWFGCGSRVIITTRDKQLLVSHHEVKIIYDVVELNFEESFKLLSWHAFKKKKVDSDYMVAWKRAINYSCGFPLALEVIGSNLYGKGVNHWCSALDQFKSIPHDQVFGALILSYDTLGEVEKQVFLDLACFFNGDNLANVGDIFQCGRGIEPKYAIDLLTDKSLIKIEQGWITMHDLIEDLGKEIVRRESPHDCGEHSRLWFYQDIIHVLQQDMGTNKVEAIILDLPDESEEIQWNGEAFMKMKNLKMLMIRKAFFSECPKYLPNSLRWLEWKGYPFKLLPYHMLPTELVYLDMPYSSFQVLQPCDKKFPNLSRMNLRNCKFLQQIPDLFGASNLRELWLDDCTSLIEIHDSVGCLNKLRQLSAMRCKNLKVFPSCLRMTSLECLNLFGCSSLERFPDISVMMEKIQELDLGRTGITDLPSSIGNLVGLKILNLEECPKLKQPPSSIWTLPNLWKLLANGCEGMNHFRMCKAGDDASFDRSAMSLKMEHLCFSNCNLSDDSLAFCPSHFTNLIHLDLSFNDFTILPECIKEYHNLKHLLLDNCNELQHIGGMPLNLEKFSAICCTSLTKLSKIKILKQAINIQPGKRNFIFPGKTFPKRLHYCTRGSFVSFWVGNVFPSTFLWILIKDNQDFVYNCNFVVRINGIRLDISSKWRLLSTIKTNHIYICDMQSMINSTELPLRYRWNLVTVYIPKVDDEIESYFGVQVYNIQDNLGNIRFVEPGRHIDNELLQQTLEQQDWEESEEDMNFDLDSTESAKSSENPVLYQDVKMMRSSQTVSPPSSHHIVSPITKYDVFLSFRGKDTRDNLASHLYKGLHKAGVFTFMDYELYKGDQISPVRWRTIEESNISMIIFSENYASSTWCMDELIYILECKEKFGRVVIPIFYNIDPSNVRKQNGRFGNGFDELKQRFKDNPTQLQRWRNALIQSTSLSGWDSNCIRPESKLVEEIVKDTLRKLNIKLSPYLEGLVGISHHIENISKLLSDSPNPIVRNTENRRTKAHIVGIWGMGGAGKTTLAKAIFQVLRDQFDGFCFIEKVKERLQRNSLDQLLKIFLKEVLKDEDISIYDIKSTFMKNRLQPKKILLVLDDVGNSQIAADLTKRLEWFGEGSRIIITSRNMQVLNDASTLSTYHVPDLDFRDAIHLFSLKAFKQHEPSEGFMDLSISIVKYCKGNPLALVVLGCFLYDREKEEWESTLEKLDKDPQRKLLMF